MDDLKRLGIDRPGDAIWWRFVRSWLIHQESLNRAGHGTHSQLMTGRITELSADRGGAGL